MRYARFHSRRKQRPMYQSQCPLSFAVACIFAMFPTTLPIIQHGIVRGVTGGPILLLTVPSCLGGSSEEQNSAANWRTTLVELMDGRMNTTALWIEV